MKNPAAIPQPERLQRRPQFRGMPIPYTALMLPDGTPDFRVTDFQRWGEVLEQRKCALCGEKMQPVIWFVGGAKCGQFRCFFDPAMHLDCCLYALEVCPFLACKSDYQPLATGKAQKAGVPLVESGIAATKRPDQFFMFATTGYVIAKHGNDDLIHVPERCGFAATPVPKERTPFVMSAWMASMKEVDAKLTRQVEEQIANQTPA